jgi:hypothetical protein
MTQTTLLHLIQDAFILCVYFTAVWIAFRVPRARR